MKTKLFVAFLALSAVGIVAYSQQPPDAPDAKPVEMDPLDRALADPRVVDRALAEPEFLKLVLADPKVGLVVAAAKFRLPLPDDPETLRGSPRVVPLCRATSIEGRHSIRCRKHDIPVPAPQAAWLLRHTGQTLEARRPRAAKCRQIA